MPERHYPAFEPEARSAWIWFEEKAFQCQNGIIPNSNGMSTRIENLLGFPFQCQNGIIPRSNCGGNPQPRRPQGCFNARTALSLVRTRVLKKSQNGSCHHRFNARTALSRVRTVLFQFGQMTERSFVSMPEQHYPSFALAA